LTARSAQAAAATMSGGGVAGVVWLTEFLQFIAHRDGIQPQGTIDSHAVIGYVTRPLSARRTQNCP